MGLSLCAQFRLVTFSPLFFFLIFSSPAFPVFVQSNHACTLLMVLFAGQVLSPWCEPTETLKGSSGLTLLRAEMHSDSGPSLQKKTEQMVEMLKPRLAEFGLDTRVRIK